MGPPHNGAQNRGQRGEQVRALHPASDAGKVKGAHGSFCDRQSRRHPLGLVYSAKGMRNMRANKALLAFSALLLPFAGIPAGAQTPAAPTVEMETTSASVGIGGQSGDGQLHLPNLGTNCVYPFKVTGFGAGIQVGISKAVAAGTVSGLTRVSDLAGKYGATSGEMTLIAGAGATNMKNDRNNVTIALASRTAGLNIGFGGSGMTIAMAEPPSNAPRAYVMAFGYNKTWVNKQNKAVLDQVANAWKCQYVNIWLFGHTDTVGKEDENLKLATARAEAAKQYLLGLGVAPNRLYTLAKGESSQLAPTEQGVRLRTNRAVGVVIQDMRPQ
jgi:OmpA family